ncbi:MAG TPA: hypothetical protein ENK17_07130 [Anaerolineae bacterium]|nr:hypothetical protein [Anaerolineae bacterium]
MRRGGVGYVRITNGGGLTGHLTGYGLLIEGDLTNALYLPLVVRGSSAASMRQEPLGTIVHSCPDEYEVDDTWEQARGITAGETQVHSFDSDPSRYAADKDFVFFDVVTKCVVTFEILPPAGTGSLAGRWVEMALYDAEGNGLGVMAVGGLRHLAAQAGRYYLGLSPVAGVGYGCVDEVGYRLRMLVEPARLLYLPVVLRGGASS